MVLEIKGADALYTEMDCYVKNNDKFLKIAINDGMRAGRAEAVRHTNEVWKGMPISILKAYTHTKPATNNNLEGIFTLASNPLPLIDFSANQNQTGVSYKLKGRRRTMAHAFINISKRTKFAHVLIREGQSRYPIQPRIAVSATYMFKDTESDKTYLDVTMEKINKRYKAQLKRCSKGVTTL